MTDKLPPGTYLVVPFNLNDDATWGDLRALVELGQHYDDADKIKLDWTGYHESQGHISEPSGVIIEGVQHG